jgi:hypothetical protein
MGHSPRIKSAPGIGERKQKLSQIERFGQTLLFQVKGRQIQPSHETTLAKLAEHWVPEPAKRPHHSHRWLQQGKKYPIG